MLDIVLVGLNHRTASIELREYVSFATYEIESALEILKRSQSINELILFSTCNRLELLTVSSEPSRVVAVFRDFVSGCKKIDRSKFERALYHYTGDDAIRHLFRVASSLDSMVLGEPQILGQVKKAYKLAILRKTVGIVLNKLLHKTFFVAKKIRTETSIGDNAVSVSYAAVELGKKIFGSLKGKKVMLLGAGNMAELAIEHLIRHQVGEVFVANRTLDRGIQMARKFGGEAIGFTEVIDYLDAVDIVISSTGSRQFVLKKDQVKSIMRNRRNQSLFFIDIAVPRDIEPEVNNVDNVYVYNIDDLKEIVNENKKDRIKEARKAELIVDDAVIQFRKWYDTLDVIPTIMDMRKKIEMIAEKELKKTFQSLNHLTVSDKEAMSRMLGSVINKILHDPTLFLKKGSYRDNKADYLDFARKLFNLC